MTDAPDLPARRDIRPAIVLGFLVILYVGVFGPLTWRQQSNFGTFGFDMGIFDQEIWLASRFKPTFITLRGLDLWANHVNPIVYLLLPFYWLGAGPHFLYALQTAALASGAVPLWLLARDRFANRWLALGIPAAWLLYPSVQWMTWWHFHPESLAVTPLLFAWWFASRQKWWWFGACAVLVAATKEDAVLAVIAVGVIIFATKNRRVGAVAVTAGLAWLLVCVKVIIPHATGSANPFYANQFSALGNTTNEIIFNAVRHPSRILRLMFQKDRHDYYVKMLAPVAGLALLAPGVLFVALPTVLINTINNQGYTHDYKFQYQAIVAAGVFIAVVEAIGRMSQAGTRRFLVGLTCAFALASNVAWSPSRLNTHVYRSGIWALHTSAHLASIDKAVHRVPGSAGVSASYTIVSHLTHRTQVYEWPNPWVRSYYGIDGIDPHEDPSKVQYLVLDAGLNETQRPLFDRLTGPGGEFDILFEENGAILAKRR